MIWVATVYKLLKNIVSREGRGQLCGVLLLKKNADESIIEMVKYNIKYVCMYALFIVFLVGAVWIVH